MHLRPQYDPLSLSLLSLVVKARFLSAGITITAQ